VSVVRFLLFDVNAEYRDVLYHTEIRRLSRGTVLKLFFLFLALRIKIKIFTNEKVKVVAELSDAKWL